MSVPNSQLPIAVDNTKNNVEISTGSVLVETKVDNSPKKDLDISNVVSNESNEPQEVPTDSVNQNELENSDLYAYLDRDEFTSEKFKIEIRDLPKYYGISV